MPTTKEQEIRTEYRTELLKAGFNEEVARRVDAVPDAVLKQMPDLPKIVNDSNAYYFPGKHELHMSSDPSAWEGHPTVFDHEWGHSVHTKTGLIIGGKIDADLQTAIERDYNGWKKAAKTTHGDAWGLFYSSTNGAVWKEAAKAIGVDDYNNADDTIKHRVCGLVDTIGGLSKGKYGAGHTKKYYKGNGGVDGYKEVFANVYRAVLNGWGEYEQLAPLTTQQIKAKLSL